MEIEHFFICPYCWQRISMLLDISIDEQEYIEDCEVCCQPIKIGYQIFENEIENFSAESIEQ